MGNAELRLTLASIENEVVETKGIAMEARDQGLKTNGNVRLHEKLIWTALGALPLLTIWAAWLTQQTLNTPRTDQAAIQTAVSEGLQEAIATYGKQN